jgi:hypothetical protein
MVDISLNCRLFRDIEENYEFNIIVNTANNVDKFKKMIRENMEEAGNDFFADIDADHLFLWQVWIRNSNKDEISNLILNKGNKNVKKLEAIGIVGEYWRSNLSKSLLMPLSTLHI